MTPSQFRVEGKKLVDFIADYYEGINKYPVLSQVKPWEVYGQLPAEPPATGESFDAMLADVEKILMPGITHWQSPGFFAYFPANASFPAILGDLLSSGLGVQGMLWATSPAATELETRVMEWLAEMLALPSSFRISSTGAGLSRIRPLRRRWRPWWRPAKALQALLPTSRGFPPGIRPMSPRKPTPRWRKP